MNKNIEVITENLWAVSYQFVNLGYIKELTFNNGGQIARLGCLTDDGKIILNKDLPYSVYVPFLKAVMQMEDSEIDTKHGFCNVIRKLINSSKSDHEIMQLIWSDSTLTYDWTIYENLCNWERARRKVAKEYSKKHPVMFLMKKIKKSLKGGV